MNFRFLIAATSFTALALTSIASANNTPNNSKPVSDAEILVSNGGTVTAQITSFGFGGYPAYNNLAYYVPSGSTDLSQGTFIGANHDFQNSIPAVTLGSISAGSEVELGLGTAFNGSNFNDIFFTGAASRNSDAQVHAFLTQIDANTCRVDFEDLPSGAADWNYGDASIIVKGVHTQAVPEPAPFVALGLGALGLIRRRKAQKA